MSAMNDYQKFIHKSKYARYLDAEGRRESWEETVRRYCDFWAQSYPKEFPYDDVFNSILNMEVMPSMRAMMTAGPALERDNIAGYNCAYLAIDNVRCFDEIMYILMCGTGVGFSVEISSTSKLPELPESFHETDTTIIVSDSRIGWASAFRELLSLLYSGKVPKWDLSRLRTAGSRLLIFGGRASGPEPLDDLFKYTVNLFRGSAGRRLKPIQVHDLVCKIADVVVVGGVRRSALLSLSDLNDPEMRMAKSGQWWEANTQRSLANNSAAYLEKPSVGVFMDEWRSLYGSKSGERGIFNRKAAKLSAESTGRRDPTYEFGTNPCAEIVLRSNGLCNLSEVVVRSTDKLEDLKKKVRLATIIGTFQSTLTDFRYLRSVWKRNAEEERLLGVSLTGIMDHKILSDSNWDEDTQHSSVEQWLKELKDEAIKVNKDFATRLGIGQSMAITTVKPSGTVSQLVDSSSGIHPRHSSYYIRTARADKKDPLAKWMREVGFPVENDVTKPDQTDVFSFPIKSPDHCVTRNQFNAISQLNHYLIYKKYWCEHNVSCTVYVKEDEWMDVQAWVYKNWDDVGGISFLPYDGGTYRQAPYQEIDEKKYLELETKMPKNVDWDSFSELTDLTSASHELACVGGICNI